MAKIYIDAKPLKKEIEKYFQGLWPGMETAEQCNIDMHFTPPAIMRLANHFYELGKQCKEPVNDDLEKAAIDIADSLLATPKDYALLARVDYWNGAHDGVIAGAEWQKEQMMDEWLKDRDGCFWDGVEEGKKAMEEQMLKDAVEGEIGYIEECDAHYLSIYDQDELEGIILSHFEEGDKVKIVIVPDKEDKK